MRRSQLGRLKWKHFIGGGRGNSFFSIWPVFFSLCGFWFVFFFVWWFGVFCCGFVGFFCLVGVFWCFFGFVFFLSATVSVKFHCFWHPKRLCNSNCNQKLTGVSLKFRFWLLRVLYVLRIAKSYRYCVQ